MHTQAEIATRERSSRTWPVAPIILAVLSACATRAIAPPATLEPSPPGQSEAAFLAAWQSYAEEIDALKIQADCQPRMYTTAAGVARRGAVVMFHGFGGCPQQLFELGQLVSERGFDVILPLLPGHGTRPDQNDKDNLSRLPTSADGAEPYAELARRMNQIMSLSPGTRVVAGFSLGGAIGFNADLQTPGLYERELLLSPMFAIRGGAFVEGLAGLLGRIPLARNMVVKPKAKREECRGWTAAGRGGFCDYQFKHVVPLLDLEDMNRQLYGDAGSRARIQIVAAGDEDYVSNGQIQDFVERQAVFGSVALCFMPADVPHEMLSAFENSGADMYWLQELLDNAVSFITDATFFPETAEGPSAESSRQICKARKQPA